MNRSKMWFGLLALVLLALPAQAAAQTEEDLSGSVTVWVYPLLQGDAANQTLWDGVVQGFSEQHPDVDVEVVVQPWAGSGQKLATALAGGVGPDIAYMIPDWIPEYVGTGALVPLNDVLSEASKDDYFDLALDSVTLDGNIYAAPILMQATAMAVNRDILEQAGIEEIPTTWEELAALGPVLQEQDLYLMRYNATQRGALNLTFYPYLWQAGGQIFADDGQSVAFDSEAGVAALSFLVDLYERGFIDPASITEPATPQEDSFGTQQAAFNPVVDNTVAGQYIDLLPEGTLELAPPLTGERQISFGTVGGLSLFAGGDAQPAAEALIRYFTTPEVMAEIDSGTGYFAPKASVSGLYADDPMLSKLEEQLPLMIPGEVHPLAGDVQGILKPELQAAILGRKSPEQALEDAAAEANRLIERQSR